MPAYPMVHLILTYPIVNCGELARIIPRVPSDEEIKEKLKLVDYQKVM